MPDETPGYQPSDTLTDDELRAALQAKDVPDAQVDQIVTDRHEPTYVMLINVLLGAPIAPPDLDAERTAALPDA